LLFHLQNYFKEKLKMANHHEKDKPIEKSSGEQSQWRPTDEPNIEPSENPTGAAGQSPAEQTGDPGRTPGKAEGEDLSKK
jgi:hypothetical protein